MGASTDAMEANASFARLYGFQFPLLCDTSRELCTVYGTCQSPSDPSAQRVTYIIGPDRRILQVYTEVNPVGHADDILAFLDQATPDDSQVDDSSAAKSPRYVLLAGDAQAVLRQLPEGSVQCALTSPAAWMGPPFELTGDDGIGGEETASMYITKMVNVFRELRRVLRDDGTLWLMTSHFHNPDAADMPKRLALALRDDGWRFERPFRWFRAEDVVDGRQWSSLDGYVLLLTKTNRYRLNPSALPSDVISIPCEKPPAGFDFLTTPKVLIEPFVLAGSQVGDMVLDPFCGAGSEGIVALKHGRNFIGIDVNADSLRLAAQRFREVVPHASGEIRSSTSASQVIPSQNGDQNGRGRGGLVYALGTIGYDFGTDAQRDAVMAAMPGARSNPDDPRQFLAHVQSNPQDAAGVFWTLNLDGVPLYVIQPHGAFMDEIYELLRQLLQSQLDDGAERVSLPGILTGEQAHLRSGQTAPVVVPDPRGMFSWSTDALINALGGEPGSDMPTLRFSLREAYRRGLSTMQVSRNLRARFQEQGITLSQGATVAGEENNWQIIDGDATYLIRRAGNQLNVYLQAGSTPVSSESGAAAASSETGTGRVRNFLSRVYDELRNRGITPQERALNHAATNAFQVHGVFDRAIQEAFELEDITIERSAIYRGGSDCWDVKLTFFDPRQRFQRARKAYRFTVDVSDVMPVTVGHTRVWSVYEAV